MMSRKRLNECILVVIAGLALVVPFLLGSTQLVTSGEMAEELTLSVVIPPAVPAKATFAGEEIGLVSYDRRERMDRELMAFSYMHSTTLMMIKRANRYFPVIEPILAANGVPDDFKYLMVIESNLNPRARSSAGAAGLWQFMEGTGREFGLEVNKNVDERYHITKSTVAACKYLKQAYDKYGDWITVAASYNAGQGRISSQLGKQKVENAMDLWLVEETSRYMFRILAAKQVFEDPRKFGFALTRDQLYPVIPFTEVKVTSGIADLASYAKQKGVTYAQLKDANPWLRDTNLENRSGRAYVLHIPQEDGMYYDPAKITPHNPVWVID